MVILQNYIGARASLFSSDLVEASENNIKRRGIGIVPESSAHLRRGGFPINLVRQVRLVSELVKRFQIVQREIDLPGYMATDTDSRPSRRDCESARRSSSTTRP